MTRGRRAARLLVPLAVVSALAAGSWALHGDMPGWYARLWYPLEHEDVIRREAERNRLDPALVAAVIEVESEWVPDSRSPRGAVGLMQLLPGTARFVARLPARPSPPPDRLTQPKVNIAYGVRYLRYLLERTGDVEGALAAYNAGEANVLGWRREAATRGEALEIPDDVPFPETRSFVARVLSTAAIYRRAYAERLAIR